MVPGLQTLSSLLVQGPASALFTLRVGIITRNCLLKAGLPFVRQDARKAANQEALANFPRVVRTATNELPDALRQLFKKLFGPESGGESNAPSANS